MGAIVGQTVRGFLVAKFVPPRGRQIRYIRILWIRGGCFIANLDIQIPDEKGVPGMLLGSKYRTSGGLWMSRAIW